MPVVNVPTDSAGLEEIMSDPAKLGAILGPDAIANGTTRSFLDAYAKEYLKRNAWTQDELRDQVQSTLVDMFRDAGGGRAPKLNFVNGRPKLDLPVSSPRAVSMGKGAAYNRATPGAKLEQEIPEAERFTEIAEYCAAIRETRGDATGNKNRPELMAKLDRIRTFQNSYSSEDPSSGGFLIPELMRSELLQLALETAIVRPRATVIPMSTLRVPIPMVDDTSHVSSLFGGMTFAWGEEGQPITESASKFGRIVLDARKLTGYFTSPNELLADAPAFSGWFDTNAPKALAWFEDLAFIVGTSAAEPQGFINCAAVATVNKESGQPSGTIVYENLTKMYARMLPTSLGKAVWICAIDTFPELATMALSVGTGGGPVWIGSFGGPSAVDLPPVTIFGRPVLFTEKAKALGTTGDINFVDLSYYLIGDRQAIQVASSEHVAFQNDKTAFRIIERVDGRPWLQSALTPHNGSANTLSAFVQLQSR